MMTLTTLKVLPIATLATFIGCSLDAVDPVGATDTGPDLTGDLAQRDIDVNPTYLDGGADLGARPDAAREVSSATDDGLSEPTDLEPSSDEEPEPGGELLEQCSHDEPCGRNLVCELGVCRAVEDALCVDDVHCSAFSGLVCRPVDVRGDVQVCQGRGDPSDPCREDDDCRRGGCGPGTSTCAGEAEDPCHVDGDCLAPYLTCRLSSRDGERRCQTRGGICEFCETDEDCDGRVCKAGLCLGWLGETGCEADGCCPGGSLCLDTHGTGVRSCVPPTDVPGAYCDQQRACKSPLACVDNKCLTPLGEGGCASNDDCVDASVCFAGFCVPPAGESEACVDNEGLPSDELCEPGLICNTVLPVCVAPASGAPGDPCSRSTECGVGDGGVGLQCHPRLDICVIPGPPIADVAVSEVIELTAPGDSWHDWVCTPWPSLALRPGYERWNYVDSLTHISNGEDDARYLIRHQDDQVCATLSGKADDNLFCDFDPSVLRFRLNSVAYNPSLIQIETRVPTSPGCPADAYLSRADSRGQACINNGEYYTQMYIPDGFDGIGLVEPVAYHGGGSSMNFVVAIVSLSELEAIYGEYRGIDVDHSLLFAAATNYLCDDSGFVGLRFHGFYWRAGLNVRAQFGRYGVAQPVSAVEQDLPAPGEDLGPLISFFTIQSVNLQADQIREDRFWLFCGSFSKKGAPCDPQPDDQDVEAFPFENEMESILADGAAEGASSLCGQLGAPADLCDLAGKGASWVVRKIFDELFDDTCGGGADEDAEWELVKERSGTGWTYVYDMTTGPGVFGDRDESENCRITVQILQLGFAKD